MKRQLSSKATYFNKIIAPIIILLFFGIVVFGNLLSAKKPPLPIIILLLALWAGFAAVLYFTLMRYMKVDIDDSFLYVSNFVKEIQIPLSEIRDVTEIVWIKGHPVTIHLKNDTEFGRKITFMPQVRALSFFSSHPVVSELKELAKIQK